MSEDADLVVILQPDIQIVTVGEVGPPGPPGPAGPASGGGAGIQMNFAYGDATPATIATVLANKVIYSIEIVITQAFDGVGAGVTVGDAGQLDRFMGAAENAITITGSNTTAPAYTYGVDTPVLLSIAPGAGATQGKGLVILRVQS